MNRHTGDVRSDLRRQRRGSKRLRRVLLWIWGVGAVVVMVVLGRLMWLIDRTGRVDEARSVDVIVVLGAGVRPDGSPGQDLIERTWHGVALYKAGWAETILFTGGQGPHSASNLGSKMAIEMGVPPDAVFPVEGPWETLGDARYSTMLMRQHSWHSALLVTHPLHCYRARRFFRQEGVVAYVSPTGPVDSVPQPWRTYYTWREAVGVIWPYLNLPDWFTTWLQSNLYGLEDQT